jgi:peptidoglycan hydrolase-like protein with peptidoglycan-binding domain
MTPAVLSTSALCLQKLGYLSGPAPSTYDGRFQQAVRRFQRAVGGLHEDGVSGPRTVMALSRVAGGRSAPASWKAASRGRLDVLTRMDEKRAPRPGLGGLPHLGESAEPRQ